MRYVNRVSNSCKIGLMGYDLYGDLTYLFLGFVFHAKFVLKGMILGKSYVFMVVLPSFAMFF